jgi:hypothetical protein
MNNREDLLKAIAAAGGLDPFDILVHLVSPKAPSRLLDAGSPLLQQVLTFLKSNRDEQHDIRVKQILWDARAATLATENSSAEERTRRLEVLDQVGRYLLDDSH